MSSGRKMTEWKAYRDGELGAAYARHSRLDQPSDSLGARKVLVNTMHAWTARNQGGVVLATKTRVGRKCLAMEFFAPLKSAIGAPCCEIQFVRTSSLTQAKKFLEGEDMEVIGCSSAIFDLIAEHVARYSFAKNLTDVRSGAALYEGIITPMPVESRATSPRPGIITEASSNNKTTTKRSGRIESSSTSTKALSDSASQNQRTRSRSDGNNDSNECGSAGIVKIKGWTAVCGCTYPALALFRVTLGILLTLELVLRFRFLHPFYSNEGTLPLPLLMDRVDDVYKAVCLHCQFGELPQQQLLLAVQVLLGVCFTAGFLTRWMAICSWYMYLSLTLRNTWMSYILDRYFHYLLFLSMFLPLDECWSITAVFRKKQNPSAGWYISPATIAVKCLVLWIYFDAGWGKYTDPLGGWTYGADPLPALDTYARHTMVAQYLYALVGPPGLRLMTPVVVYIEILAAPVALAGAFFGSNAVTYTAVMLICSLHLGIALTLRNAALLSFVACTAWCSFLPIGGREGPPNAARPGWLGTCMSVLFIGTMVAGSLWLETISQVCDQSVKHVWSTLLHNRWNVFVGAEEYVTWEIAPGLLKDGSFVDVWGRRDTIDWSLPGGGAPCTATARPGRWRSFPYLAGLEGEEGEVLWRYLCNEWDRENQVDKHPGRQLIKYNFFLLQADVLPEMHFSETRKRLIISYDCVPSNETANWGEKEGLSATAIPEGEPVELHEPETTDSQSSEPEFPKASDPESAEPEFFDFEHNEPVSDML
jgi:hypothetical protein